VTVRFTVWTLPAGTTIDPELGLRRSRKSPEVDALQTRFAGVPLAKMVSGIVCTLVRARQAPGRSAVTGRGGIQSNAAAEALPRIVARSATPTAERRAMVRLRGTRFRRVIRCPPCE
jgi:hypothetical protein